MTRKAIETATGVYLLSGSKKSYIFSIQFLTNKYKITKQKHDLYVNEHERVFRTLVAMANEDISIEIWY